MSQVTLAKALKLKNRQVQKVKDIQGRIEACNSYLRGADPDFDASELYSNLKLETLRLWRIKSAINTANVPVHEAIYELAEVKGLIAFLKGLDTKRGRALVAYTASGPQDYIAQITAGQAQVEVEALERRIDELQEMLDAHNANVQVELEV